MFKKDYPVIKKQPVAKFFYKGQSHTHPVRRTVVITEATFEKITGYEIREGSKVRNLKKAPIKSYSRNKIAKVGEIDRRRVLRSKTTNMSMSTLERKTLVDLLREGA